MPLRAVVAIATGLLLIGLGLVFLLVGLDSADQLASVVGALASVAGLGLSGWALVSGRASSNTARKVVASRSVFQTGRFSRQYNDFTRRSE